MQMKTIAVIASCDTKLKELTYIKKFIENAGHRVLVIDISIGIEEPQGFDIPREDVIAASGHHWENVKNLSKGELMELAVSGITKLIPELYAQGKFDAVFSMGGVQNTSVAVSGMKQLPIGVPKVMLSTVASGNRTFEPLVGTRDIVLIPSIADLAGVNTITRTVMENAASCVIGMVNNAGKPLGNSDGVVVGTTLMGITNDGVCSAINHLTSKGIETIGFHSTGVGGRAMEELAAGGTINAVMDLTIHEITSEYFGGGFSYGAPDRLTMLCRLGIPLLVSPGGLDFVDYPLDNMPKDIDKRKYIRHNAQLAHIKILKHEGIDVAKITAERLNQSKSEVTLLIPTNGFRKNTRPGEPLYDKEVDDAIIETLIENIYNDNVIVKYVDANLNEESFGIAAANEMIEILKRFGKLDANFDI
ncbi:MAG: hypothetical protein APF77_09340 [Clostridia bacterium BRH_c25]|nr:MAG: hypothetical protein APF77_09340 [Clostridia bacterium BRH_c25]